MARKPKPTLRLTPESRRTLRDLGVPTTPAKRPANITDGEAQYLLALLSVDGGEHADEYGVDTDALATAIAASHNLCPDCQGTTGNKDCPTCGGDGYAPEDEGHGPCGGNCAPHLKDGEACALCGHVAGNPCRGDCPPLPLPKTAPQVRAWLAALHRAELLWHMDDDPLECVWTLKGGRGDIPVSLETKRALRRQQDAALAACRKARVDIFELYPEVA